ncbi:hypothetical protein [Clostridium estertheticum]|nr:hypothetical protein [Clostridium estertheticum]
MVSAYNNYVNKLRTCKDLTLIGAILPSSTGGGWTAFIILG